MEKFYHSALFIILIIFFGCNSNKNRTVKEEVSIQALNYFPPQRKDVSDETYYRAMKTLKGMYNSVRERDSTFNYGHHFNIFNALLGFKEPKEIVVQQLNLAYKKSEESTANIFLAMYPEYEPILQHYFTKNEYDSLVDNFKAKVAQMEKEIIDIESYSEAGGFDSDLVNIMANLKERDQRHRKGDKNWDLQNEIDKQNMVIIDSLYNKYETYIGNTLVGKKFNYVMWAVIQHADLEHQLKYLPVLQKAVKENELPKNPLKMLIDRIYSKQYGFQIYGSQMNRPLAPDSVIKEVQKKFNLF